MTGAGFAEMPSNLPAQPKRPVEYHIGRYRILARLGKGGMGIVYLGRDQALDRDVAIKTLRVDGPANQENRGRFEIEAKAAARLQHPNIVTVFELGEDRGLPFIAMEFLGGEDLETLLRAGEEISVVDRLDIVIQTLRGLEFAHTHRIIHRDIKPSNIRVLDDGGVKILDFGIAKLESTAVTKAGMMVGTPYYMSPEHIRGGVLDGRSDVFAVGVILHELFAGSRPFTAKDPTQVLFKIVKEPHPPLESRAAGPRTGDIQRVIDKALAKEADDRYSSAGAMADDLIRVKARCASPSVPSGDAAALAQAKRNLSTRETDPSVLRTVEAIALRNPDAAEPRRLLRILRRKTADTQPGAQSQTFPELDATFAAPTTGHSDATVITHPPLSRGSRPPKQAAAREAERPQPVQPGPSNVILYLALAASILTGAVATFLYFNRPAPAASPARSAAAVPSETLAPVEAPQKDKPAGKTAREDRPTAPPAAGATEPGAEVKVRITSEPSGATVRLDRKVIGVTPLTSSVASAQAHSITLSLGGYEPRDIRLDKPIPSSVNAVLAPANAPGSLVVKSPYPVRVTVSGRQIANNELEVTTSLPAGAHEVLIESAAVFLQRRESVRVEAGGTFTLNVPPTGTLGVRASPDNCKVFINGAFVDYPPIIDRKIVAGNHLVSFEWPDGTRSDEMVVIQAGRPSYVMGRKP